MSSEIVPNKKVLLLRIETDYIVDPEQRPLEYWHHQHAPKIPLELVQRRSHKGRWGERRRAYWLGVQAAYLKQTGNRLIQSRCSETIELEGLRNQIFALIRPKVGPGGVEVFPLPTRSYEGMIRAFVQLEKLVELKRDHVMEALAPMLTEVEAQRGEKEQIAIPFSQTEVREMAHRLLERRRDERLALTERASEETEDDDDNEGGADEEDDGDDFGFGS